MHFNDVLNLAAKAWHETKAEEDPEFNDCAVSHREKLGAQAQGVVSSGQAFDRFDRVVLRLYKERQEAQSKAEQLLEQHPTAHGDEVMHMASGLSHPLQGGHAEAAQMAAVREEFRGADASGFAAPVKFGSQGGVIVTPNPLPTENLKGTFTVSETDAEVSATVNIEPPPKPEHKKSSKRTKKVK